MRVGGGDVYERVRHRYGDDRGVRIHWRDQMAAPQRHYQVVAIDRRGYDLTT